MRDDRLDLIRGFAILLITINHTLPGPSLLSEFGHYFLRLGMLFNGADIFVASSGLVCGIVYRRHLDLHGFLSAMKKALVRSLQILFLNALAFVVVAAVVAGFAAFGILAPSHVFSAGESMLGTVLLFSPAPYFNILNFYVLMLLLMPPFIWLQQRKQFTIAASGAVYLGYFFLRYLGFLPEYSGPFFGSPWAWQFLFFGAVVVGMNYRTVRAGLPGLRNTIGWCLLYFLVIHFMKDQQWIVHNFSSKKDLGILRIVDLVLVFYIVDRLVHPGMDVTSPALRKIRAIGQESLFAFSVSLVLCYAASIIGSGFDGNRAVYLGVLLLELGALLLIGHSLLTYPSFRHLVRMKWLERPVSPARAPQGG